MLSCGETRLYPIRAVDGAIVQPPMVDASIADASVESVDRPAPMDAPRELPPGFECPPPRLVGFATTGAGTTGGGTVLPVTVTTLADLITLAASDDEPRVIEIPNTIELTDQVRVKANKTIRGTARGAGLLGGGLYLRDSKNVIVQRLTIARALGTDAIGLDNAQNIWIDHCDLSSELTSPKKTYDGLVDITHASINVTVSWTKFHDHYNPSLVGHSVNNILEDTGALTVTFHHNWFENTPNNAPRVRFGTVHVFNSLHQNIEGAIASQMDAQVLVENCVFQNVLHPLMTHYEDEVDGYATEIGSLFDIGHGPEIGAGRAASWRPTYPYIEVLDLTDLVEPIVKKCAGPNL